MYCPRIEGRTHESLDSQPLEAALVLVLLQRIGSVLLGRRAAARGIVRLLRQLLRLAVDRIATIILISNPRTFLHAFFPSTEALSSLCLSPFFSFNVLSFDVNPGEELSVFDL